MKEEVENALKAVPQFRERATRGHYIFILTMKKLGVIEKGVKVQSGDKIEFTIGTPKTGSVTNDFISVAQSYDRYWRQVLEEHEELRGKDYNTKDIVEQEKQIELGYIPTLKESEKYFDM